ncbi:MAG: MurT ligase domain-containing protein [Propionibacteriaceae bacterium]|nr:MurT ligase domain-containing protein [Propionibacteriaceae bacterium]
MLTLLRFFVALWAAKLTIWFRRITKAESSDIPGRVAMHLFPEFLAVLRKPPKVICITGTNGKTTVSNLVTDALRAEGYTVANNSTGYNTRNGVALTLIEESTFWGRPRTDVAVLETYEHSSATLFPALHPDFVVCTNIIRDSVPFNGYPEFIAGLIESGIRPEMTLILNADDLICAALGACGSRKVMFGVGLQPDDTVTPTGTALDVLVCPECQTTLIWDYWRYSHIGRAHCPECGFASPEADYLVTSIDSGAQALTITCPNSSVTSADEQLSCHLFVNNMANIYNQVTLVALLHEFGVALPRIAELFSAINIVPDRWAEDSVGEVTIIRQLAKGQVGTACSRAFSYIAGLSGKKAMVLNLDDVHHIQNDVENTCWLYDADYEFLANSGIEQIVVGGVRRHDHILRLLIAGVEPNRIRGVADELSTADMLSLDNIDTILNVYNEENIFTTGAVIQDRFIERLRSERGDSHAN